MVHGDRELIATSESGEGKLGILPLLRQLCPPPEPTKWWGWKNQELVARYFMGYDGSISIINSLMSGSVLRCVYTLNIADLCLGQTSGGAGSRWIGWTNWEWSLNCDPICFWEERIFNHAFPTPYGRWSWNWSKAQSQVILFGHDQWFNGFWEISDSHLHPSSPYSCPKKGRAEDQRAHCQHPAEDHWLWFVQMLRPRGHLDQWTTYRSGSGCSRLISTGCCTATGTETEDSKRRLSLKFDHVLSHYATTIATEKPLLLHYCPVWHSSGLLRSLCSDRFSLQVPMSTKAGTPYYVAPQVLQGRTDLSSHGLPLKMTNLEKDHVAHQKIIDNDNDDKINKPSPKSL